MRKFTKNDLHFSASPIMFWATRPYLNDRFSGSPVQLTYYTHPLCPWSWAQEPVFYKFLQTYGQRVRLRFRMAEMSHGQDLTLKSAAMADTCAKIASDTGVQINPAVWKKNPVALSAMACTAFKCADRQGENPGALYLSLLRLAAMGQGKDISNTTTLMSIAQTVSGICPEFDTDQFTGELENGSGYLAMEEDLRYAHAENMEGMPCMVLECGAKTVRLRGYQTLEQLATAMHQLTDEEDVKTTVKRHQPERSVYLSYR